MVCHKNFAGCVLFLRLNASRPIMGHRHRVLAWKSAAVGMALFLICRPLAGLFEPIPRPDAASIRKLKAEGTLVELIIFLGWLIDTRRFTIALPIDKWKAWRSNIIILRDKRIVSYSELSSLIGRLIHHPRRKTFHEQPSSDGINSQAKQRQKSQALSHHN